LATRLNWGIIGAGSIAGAFARALKDSKTGQLVAVGSRTRENADRFGEEHGVGRRYGSYDALLADSSVDAVYIATLHPQHAEWAVKAAEAGKQILCEKPLTMNHPEAMAVAEAARRHGVFLMEAFMYRCHPQTARLAELLREKTIGDVKIIDAVFSFNGGGNPESRLNKAELGGGGILDVGCYCVSMARLAAGAALGLPFADPIQVSGAGHLGEATGTDEYAVATLRFDRDILARLSTGVRLNQESVVRIYGSEGTIVVPSPWFCGPTDGAVKIIVHRHGEERREVVIETDRSLYAYEADAFAEGVETGTAPYPAMSPEDSLGNMMTLDRWRQAIQLVYPMEKPEGQTRPFSGKPLEPRPGNNMKYGRVEGVELPVSKIVMGTMLEGAVNRTTQASALFDDFIEWGGNCFDTAYVYGTEAIVGNWVERRGIRDRVALIAKGAHTPYCTPEWLTRQLYETLDRLRTDYADLYLMHRDNLDVPVAEFVDALNEHVQAGRMKAFGGSNWSLERVQAANDYAASKGLQGFSAVSNNFSLARMVQPIWDGCIAASDPESREWLTAHQMPLFSWSSQARGFFIRANPEERSDAELVRAWYSDDNFRRLERAKDLAARKGVPTITVAAAYVLCQPFPAFALIGPRTLTEMRTSMEALETDLTPEELRWLDLQV
jgi:predicted dehydrogenase/aryl-alcohol dehydrogenase-like predicted oxidoreductase